jgi:hypothetical protein
MALWSMLLLLLSVSAVIHTNGATSEVIQQDALNPDGNDLLLLKSSLFDFYRNFGDW